MLRVLWMIVTLVASQLILVDSGGAVSVTVLGPPDILSHKVGLIIRRAYNTSGVTMDSDDLLADTDLDGVGGDGDSGGGDSPFISMDAPSTLDENSYNVFYFPPRINTSSTVPRNYSASTEFTQMVSIMAFFTIVVLAIGAWLLSKHCCFKDKSLRGRSSSNVGAVSSSTTTPTTVSSSRPPQFNFLGVQGRRPNNRSNGAVITMDKPDDLPPSYEDLFPDVVVLTHDHPSIAKEMVGVRVTNSSDFNPCQQQEVPGSSVNAKSTIE